MKVHTIWVVVAMEKSRDFLWESKGPNPNANRSLRNKYSKAESNSATVGRS